MIKRPRRNRSSKGIRALIRETNLSHESLIQPLFVMDGENKRIAIPTLPDIDQLTTDHLLREVESCLQLGVSNFKIFPVVGEDKKDESASFSHEPRSFYLHAIREVKLNFPEVTIISDVSMSLYTTSGHAGLVVEDIVDNDRTLPVLAAMSLVHCDAGVDILGLSDKMDGNVGYVREVIADHGFDSVSIMADTANYASSFFLPFQRALGIDLPEEVRGSYQMDPANKYEVIRAAILDIDEGADLLMVQPASHYMDIIHLLREKCHLPIIASHASGEYAMLKAAAERGWLSYEDSLAETLIALKRAGAQGIISYGAKDFARSIKV